MGSEMVFFLPTLSYQRSCIHSRGLFHILLGGVWGRVTLKVMEMAVTITEHPVTSGVALGGFSTFCQADYTVFEE
jgi:hypothetical protein